MSKWAMAKMFNTYQQNTCRVKECQINTNN